MLLVLWGVFPSGSSAVEFAHCLFCDFCSFSAGGFRAVAVINFGVIDSLFVGIGFADVSSPES